jgi:hypothetical protein
MQIVVTEDTQDTGEDCSVGVGSVHHDSVKKDFPLQVFPGSGSSLDRVPGEQLVYHWFHIVPVPIPSEVEYVHLYLMYFMQFIVSIFSKFRKE